MQYCAISGTVGKHMRLEVHQVTHDDYQHMMAIYNGSVTSYGSVATWITVVIPR